MKSIYDDIEPLLDKSKACWLWTRRINLWGYGVFSLHGRTTYAHRVMWEKYNTKSAAGQVLMHQGDTPACCNPDHLEAGTHADNQRDKFLKNRHAQGDTMGTAKLNSEKVREMRRKHASGSCTYLDLAREYSVCRDTVQKAVSGRYWKNV